MALSKKEELEILRKQTIELDSQRKKLEEQRAIWKQLNSEKRAGKKIDEELLKKLKEQFDTVTDLDDKIKEISKELKDKQKKYIEEYNKELEKQLENYEDIEDTVKSINTSNKSGIKTQRDAQKLLNQTKTIVGSITTILTTGKGVTLEQSKAVGSAVSQYKNFQSIANSALSDLEKGNISQQEYAALIGKSYEEFQTLTSSIDTSTRSGKKLKKELDRLSKLALPGVIKAQIKDFDVLNNSIKKVGAELGTNSQTYKTLQQDAAALVKPYDNISNILIKQKDMSTKQVDIVKQTTAAYTQYKSIAAQATLELEQGKITAQQYGDKVQAVYDYFKELSNEIDRTTASGAKLGAEIDKLKAGQEESIFATSIQDTEDLEKWTNIISSRLGKNDSLAMAFQKKLAGTKIILQDMAASTFQIQGLNAKQLEQSKNAAKAYQQMNAEIAKAATSLSIGEITQEQYNSIVQSTTGEFRNIVDAIDDSTDAGRELKEVFRGAADEAKNFEAAAKNSSTAIGLMDQAFEGFSGVPAMSELNRLLKTNKADTVALTLAVAALGAALAKAAFDYFGAGIKENVKAQFEAQKRGIEGAKQVRKIQTDALFNNQKISQEVDKNRVETANNVAKAMNDAAFAGQRAAIQFSAAVQSAAAEFRAASKTALFGNKLGSVGYAASSLQMAGVGAEAIANQMQAAANATGQMPTAEMGADMAVVAKRTGQSAENIGQLNEYFQRTEGVSAKTALNMQEGMRAMAEKSGLNLSNFMKEVAEASKDALSYNIKSGPALAKQVAYAQSLGVSFGDIAKAGKNMVLNYKDSIKAEMQLSSLLGEQVDLSEVRQKFAEGDTQGALEALKAQGLDPADMDMFQQQALSEALGGMDVSSISKIATKTGKDAGDLKAGDTKKGNEKFLADTKEAQRQLTSDQASISAQTAVLDAKLSGQITDAYLNSPAYKKYLDEQARLAQNEANLATQMDQFSLRDPEQIKLNADLARKNMEQGIVEGLMSGAVAMAGAFIAALLSGGIGKIFGGGGGLLGMFGKKGGGGGGAPEMPGGGGAPEMPGGGGGPGGAGPMGGKGGGPAAAVQKVFDTIKSIVKGIGDVLKQGVKIVMDLGNQLAGGVMKILNTVMGGLEKASGTLPGILGNLGKAVGSFFSGMTTGLTTFAMAMATPTPLFGLPVGLIIVGMAMGLAKALSIAAPGIQALTPLLIGLAEVIGGTFVKVLEAAGPIITGIFDGIAKVITAVGDVIAKVISAVGDSLVKIGSISGGNLIEVAAGVAALAPALVALGAGELINGIMGFVGSLFGGGESIWDKLIQLSTYGPGLKQAADAVSVLAPAFAMLSKVEEGDNLAAVMDNLKSAMDKVDKDMLARMKDMGPSMAQLGYGASALSRAQPNAGLPVLAGQIAMLLNPDLMKMIQTNLPTITTLGTTLTSFATTTSTVGSSLAAVNPQFIMLMSNLKMFSAIGASLDVTTAALLRMASALREVAAINTSNLGKIPWAQMTNFSASPGGNFVLAKSANNNFTIEKNTAANIADIDAQSKVNNAINKNLQNILMAILDVNTGKEGQLKLVIDGKPVTKMIQKRADDRKGGNADGK